jgi:ribosomal protein S18 acetylase RimI-like enzyme
MHDQHEPTSVTTEASAEIEVKLRWGQASDFNDVARLSQESGTRPITVRELRYKMTFENATLLLARRLGTTIGYALVREKGRTTQLLDLVVARPHRRCGVGEALLDLLDRQFLERRGGKCLFVRISERREEAMRFLLSSGFRLVKRLAYTGPGTGTDRYLFVRRPSGTES